jgi:hypothetical protein
MWTRAIEVWLRARSLSEVKEHLRIDLDVSFRRVEFYAVLERLGQGLSGT